MHEGSEYNLVFLQRICLNVILIGIGLRCIPMNFKVNRLLLASVKWNIMQERKAEVKSLLYIVKLPLGPGQAIIQVYYTVDHYTYLLMVNLLL